MVIVFGKQQHASDRKLLIQQMST